MKLLIQNMLPSPYSNIFERALKCAKVFNLRSLLFSLNGHCGSDNNGLMGHEGDTAGGQLIADLLDGLFGDQSILELRGKVIENIGQVDILNGVEDVKEGDVNVVAAQVAKKKEQIYSWDIHTYFKTLIYSPLDSQNIVANCLDLGRSFLNTGLLAQGLQPLEHIQMAEGHSAFGLHIALGIVGGNWQPGALSRGESSQLLVGPVHRSARRITGVVHVVCLIAVAGLGIHGVLPGHIPIEHAQLLAVVSDTAARQGQKKDVE